MALATRLLTAVGLVSAALALTSFARPRAVPRTPAMIGSILDQGPHAGECGTCHTQHAGDQPIAYEHALVGPDDNTLCDRCHVTAWTGGSYGGAWLYAGSAHGSSGDAVWPGPYPPARSEADAARKCLNCHDPHGWEDGAGVIPRLTLAREEALCLACHDGAPAAANIRADITKPFAHPSTTLGGRHTGPTESLSSDFAISPINRRHAECVDCHDPHVARHDAGLPPAPPAASKTLLGVSRVAVVNGAAGSAPSYRFIAGADTVSAPVAEYQLCFKCHSSWTTQPAGQTDLARVLNPANLSYHPVEAQGRDATIDPAAFTAGWGPTAMTRCGDCHGSDLGISGGPHGSLYRYILKRPYTASS
ncbi:MAG: cytochrome c3 family protein, partial [Candidatus Eisenbacteria bacterium]